MTTDLTTLRGHSFSHSRRQRFQDCKRKLFYRDVAGFEPLLTPKPLRMGIGFGTAIEARDIAAVPPLYEKYVLQQQSARDQEALKLEVGIIQVMAAAYLERFPLPMIREFMFELPIERTHWQDYGFMDGLSVEYGKRATGGNGWHVVIIEDKFKGQWSAADIRALALDQQSTAMLAAYDTLVASDDPALFDALRSLDEQSAVLPVPEGFDPSEHVAGLVYHPVELRYRVTKKPSLVQRLKPTKKEPEPETDGEYLIRIQEDVADPTQGGKKLGRSYISEHVVSRTPDFFVEHRDEVMDLAFQLDGVLKRGVFPRNPARCGDYGQCEFLAVCDGRDRTLAGFRKKADWSAREDVHAPDA